MIGTTAFLISSLITDILFKEPPLTVTSSLDHETNISKDRWAVTLIRTKSKCFNNHAEIVIEGIANNKHFIKYAHFVGEKSCFSKTGMVKSGDIDTSRTIEFIDRSNVMLCPCQTVRNMLVAIEQERDRKVDVPKLNFCGRGSYAAKEGEDNCITWALGKLKIAGIQFAPTSHFVTLTSSYTSIPR